VNSLLPAEPNLGQQLGCRLRRLQPNIGIVGTPVIDLGTDTIYVVTKSKTTSGASHHQLLHALDITTGSEKFSGPVEISASVPGTGTEAAAVR
jgi:hypothetical protein